MSNHFVVSIDNNLLKVTLFNKKGSGGVYKELPEDLVSKSKIKHIADFSEFLKATLLELNNGRKFGNNDTLAFLVNPEEVILRLVTVAKSDQDLEEFILGKVQSEDSSFNSDAMHYSYQKIAPFVYQFVGIDKDKMDEYLEVANLVGISLAGVVPWCLLLPKIIGSSAAEMYVINNAGDRVVILSELNGVYFSSSFEKSVEIKDFAELLEQFSIFKRISPVKKIYKHAIEEIPLKEPYKIVDFPLPEDLTEEKEPFLLHFLCQSYIESAPDFYKSQANLINLLPLPVKANNKSLVFVGSSVGVALALVLVAGGLYFRKNTTTASVNESKGDEAPVVLASSESATETVPLPEDPVEEEVALSKEDLKIRVENGAGVAGIAGKTGDFLAEFGYEIVSVGNADNVDYEKTLLRFKEAKIDYKDLLTVDMDDDYEVVVEDTLDASEDYDVLVIVGAK
jgi:hypothetical protein